MDGSTPSTQTSLVDQLGLVGGSVRLHMDMLFLTKSLLSYRSDMYTCRKLLSLTLLPLSITCCPIACSHKCLHLLSPAARNTSTCRPVAHSHRKKWCRRFVIAATTFYFHSHCEEVRWMTQMVQTICYSFIKGRREGARVLTGEIHGGLTGEVVCSPWLVVLSVPQLL